MAQPPNPITVLELLLCVDFNRFTEHDELLLEHVLADAKKAIEHNLVKQLESKVRSLTIELEDARDPDRGY